MFVRPSDLGMPQIPKEQLDNIAKGINANFKPPTDEEVKRMEEQEKRIAKELLLKLMKDAKPEKDETSTKELTKF